MAGSRRRPTRRSAASTAGAAGRCSSAAPGSTCGRSSTSSTRPGSGRTSGPSSTPSRDTVALHRAAAPSSTRSPRRRIEPANRRRVVRALEVTARQRPAVLVVRARARRLPADRRRRRSACAGPAPMLAERIAAALRRDARRRPRSTRSERLAAAPGGLSRTAAQALGYKELLAHLDGRVARSTRPSTLAVTAHPPVRRAPAALVPPRPPHTLGRRCPTTVAATPSPVLVRAAAADDRPARSPSTTASGNDFLVLLRPIGRRPALGVGATLARRALRPPPRHRRRRAARRRADVAAAADGRRRARWCSTTPTAAGPR